MFRFIVINVPFAHTVFLFNKQSERGGPVRGNDHDEELRKILALMHALLASASNRTSYIQ